MRVISERYPFLTVRVELHGQTFNVDALVDSGFAGGLAVPSGLFAPRRLPQATNRWRIADGSVISAPAFAGLLSLGPFPPIAVAINFMGSVSLLGQAVLRNFAVVLEHGRRVIVQE